MRSIFFLVFNFYLAICLGQNTDQEIAPPGTLQLTENLFLDKSPVTNLMFLEYLTMKEYLQSQGYNSWKTYYIEKEELDWERGLNHIYPSYLKALKTEKSLLSRRGYFGDPKYMRTPVLRITKVQAADYCQWRTEMVEYAWKYFPHYAGQKEFADRIQYRLPSREELEAARNYFSEKDQVVHISKKNPLKYKSSSTIENFTLYNISEFTSSNSLFGENWKDVVSTEFPNDFTGCRCVCEVGE